MLFIRLPRAPGKLSSVIWFSTEVCPPREMSWARGLEDSSVPATVIASFHVINNLLSGLETYPVNLVNVNRPCGRCADSPYIGASWVVGSALGPGLVTRMMNGLAAHVLSQKWYLVLNERPSTIYKIT